MNSRKTALSLIVVGLAALLLVLGASFTSATNDLGPPPVGGKVLVRGAPIHGTNGIMFDSKDRLHIASVHGGEIVVMDPQTGKILERLGAAEGVQGPDDLTFGPDGSLYWTDSFTGEVGQRSPTGTTTKQFVAPGVNPITFSDDGRLFVALDFFGDALYELDPHLQNPPRLIAENLGFLNGMDWGPDGFLYGPIFTQDRVVRIAVDAVPFTMATVADGFGIPAAVKFDSHGRLHVLDALSGEVVRVDRATGGKTVIATLVPGLDNLAFDSQDRLFISSFIDGFIVQVLPSGQARTVSKGGMIAPGGVAVVPRPHGGESVFVADVFSLREFDGRTGRPQSVEKFNFSVPYATGGILDPLTVSPDGDNLVLADGGAVQVWNPERREVLEAYLDFAGPLNAIRFQGDLAVAELLTGRVVRASDRVALASGLLVPAGLAATAQDLWVSDWATGSVWQIVDDGKSLMKPVATGLSHPEGLAVDLDGSLLVVESGAGRLSRINLETGAVSLVAEGLALGAPALPGRLPTMFFNGVAVGPSGAIYVTGDVANVLYRFRPSR